MHTEHDDKTAKLMAQLQALKIVPSSEKGRDDVSLALAKHKKSEPNKKHS